MSGLLARITSSVLQSFTGAHFGVGRTYRHRRIRNIQLNRSGARSHALDKSDVRERTRQLELKQRLFNAKLDEIHNRLMDYTAHEGNVLDHCDVEFILSHVAGDDPLREFLLGPNVPSVLTECLGEELEYLVELHDDVENLREDLNDIGTLSIVRAN